MTYPITITSPSILPVLEAARELVLASNGYRWAPSGSSETRVIVADRILADLGRETKGGG